jgi:cyclopropane fatty-acyl-phospholipid synthase-like methyltransferase
VLVEESLKIKEFVEHLNLKDMTVLDLGSAEERFRKYVQPYIDRNIFKPLRKRGCKIQHLDLYGNEGIDMRLDFADLEKVHSRYDLVLCCNSMEHVTDLGKIV